MAINTTPQTTLIDLLKLVTETMDVNTRIIKGLSEQDINREISLLGTNDTPALLYTLEQRGRKLINPSRKARRSYNVLIAFADKHEDDDNDALDRIAELHATSDLFLQRLLSAEAVKVTGLYQDGIESEFQEEIYAYDGSFASVTLRFTLTIDPSIPTPECL